MTVFLENDILTQLQSAGDSNMALMLEAFDPVDKKCETIAFNIGISLWLQIHLHLRGDVVYFRNVVYVIVCWLTPHFIDLIILRMADPHPEHSVFDSF